MTATKSERYMAKAPPNAPTRKDRVRLRGKGPLRQGVVEKCDDSSKWATVVWDDGGGPRNCHLFELEVVRADDVGS